MANVFRRVSAAVDLLRPQTFFRTLARVDELADATRALRAQVTALEIRTSQLMALERTDGELREHLPRLTHTLDIQRIASHVRKAVDAAPLEPDPFPHIVVTGWLPSDVYEALITGIPPAVFFAEGEPNRQRLPVPFPFAPAYSQRVWRFMAEHVVGECLQEALAKKFADSIAAYVRGFCHGSDAAADIRLSASDGRIMLRRPGYVIEPHRDPKWGFLTGLAYLARPGDDEAHGTRLYRVNGDSSAPSGKPYYVDRSRCELVTTVPFRPNTLLVFLNSTGAHGASIPADAQPPTLERYVYQFRLGPPNDVIRDLLARMDPVTRAAWAGAKSARAGTST